LTISGNRSGYAILDNKRQPFNNKLLPFINSMDNDNGVNPSSRCSCCCKAQAVLRFRLNEYCFDCLLDGLEPLQPGWGVALELRAEGYDLEVEGDG
jgi:hypothetical protein